MRDTDKEVKALLRQRAVEEEEQKELARLLELQVQHESDGTWA